MSDRAALVVAEQIRTLYGQSVTGAVSQPFAGVFFVWAFWSVGERAWLIAWFCCLVGFSIARLLLYAIFRRRADEQPLRRWGVACLSLVFLQGATWGVAWLVFIPTGDPLHLVLVALLAVGLSGVGSIGYVSDLTALAAFSAPVLLPATGHLLALGDRWGLGLGLVLIVYIVALVRAMLPVHRAMVQAITLNYELEDEISARSNVEEKLREASITDGLTGLANRRHFDEVLGDELRRAERGDYPLSLILIDVDYFKAYNDTYGHVAGDDCLQRVSAVVRGAAKRPGDLAARYGGEELVVLLPGTAGEDSLTIAETIRAGVQALAIEHRASDCDCGLVTVSAGVATMQPERDSTTDDLLRLADESLYEAKRRGRNSVVGP